MSPEALAEAGRWMRTAASDLRTVEILMAHPDPPFAQVCYPAQQAAEKALKALLTARSLPFPRTHDLALLGTLLPAGGLPGVPSDTLADLSYFAVGPRYPGDLTDYDRPLVASVVAKARAVVAAVEHALPAQAR